MQSQMSVQGGRLREIDIEEGNVTTEAEIGVMQP